jgi:hypothetical protein
VNTITVPVQKATEKLFKKLERHGLVRRLLPTRKALSTRTATGTVDKVYKSSPRSGVHGLYCVGKRATSIRLRYHKDNEEFLLVKPPAKRYKTMYLIVAWDRYTALQKKVRSGKVSAKDFVAIECVYNDPLTSFFSMNKYTVHDEVTCGGAGQHPIFFVTESAGLGSFSLQGERFRVNLKGVN